MEKGLLAIALSILIILSPISYAYELKVAETDPLDSLVEAILEIQNKVTGFVITKPPTTVNTQQVTKAVQEAQSRVQESIQTLNNFDSHTYVYFGDKIIEKVNTTNDVYFHSDHLGSTRLVTDSSGNRISENSYEPFGSDQISSNNKFKFTGKEEDSSNLYYYGARYYDPEFGRFTQIDPMFDPGQTTYAYADNRPIKYTDPDGKVVFIPPVVYGAAAALTAYGQAAMSDPSFVQDTHDFTDAWKEKDWWVLSFAVLGMAAQGGSGRGIREGVDAFKLKFLKVSDAESAEMRRVPNVIDVVIKTSEATTEEVKQRVVETVGDALSKLNLRGGRIRVMRNDPILSSLTPSVAYPTKDVLENLKAEGLTLKEIAKLYGVDASTVSRWSHGSPMRKTRQVNIEDVKALEKRGVSRAEIARLFGINPSTVFRMLKKDASKK